MRMFCTRAVLCALAFGLPGITWAAPQMTTPGSFGVSPRGEATYSIGIQIPPGISGIEPSITLMYSSDSGNGRLGVDWNLGGTSEIHRCPQTNAQDGGVRAVSMDASDRLCIDGARLVVLGGAAYGSEGAEYRTEIDGFSKIISHTSVGNGPAVSNGPAWFEVWTKAGQYKTYGNSTDSRVLAVGVSPATARVWALNRVQDALSNYMTYTYTQDSVNGDYYPAQINYTGNATKSQATTSQISFTWATRPDTVTVYQAGAKITGTVRLTDIKTYIGAGATLVRDYKLAYLTSPTTGRSEITSITECPATGGCMPATSFAWTNHVKGMTDKGAAITGLYSNWATSGRIFVADVNGDGISDIVMGPDATGTWNVMLGNGTGFTNKGAWITGVDAEWVAGADGIRVMDVNGDGLADIEMGPDGNGDWFVLLSTGTSFTDGGKWLTGKYANWTSARPRIYPIDVNGDGLEDLVLGPDGAGNWYVLQSDGTKFVDKGAWATGAYANWTGAATRTYVADINGDGLQDVVLGPDGAGSWYVLRSTGTSFANDGAWITGLYANWATGTDGIRAMDVNGDGLSDIEMGPDASGNWYVLLSTGKKFVNGGTWATGKYAGYVGGRNRIYATDTNGDGLQDLLMGPDAAGTWNVLRSTGTSFVDDGAVTTNAYGNWTGNASITRAMDMNGDGLKDIVLGPDGSGNWYHIDSNPANERITGINNGLASMSLTYAPMTSAAVYTKDSGTNAAHYPLMDMQFPGYVVSSITSPDGIGGTVTSNYTYGGFKIDLTGRGMLGPRWIKATRPAVGAFAARSSYTVYNQQYPLNGLVALSQDMVTGGGSGGVLSETDNTYQCYSGSASPVPTASSCTLATGLRYLPYTYQSIEKRWDLNGAVLPTVTNTFTYDTWGNATQIDRATTDGFDKKTVNTYLAADTSKWILGRLSTAKVTSTSPQTVPGYLVTTPLNLTATAVAAKQVNLAWTAATDTGGPGITGYHVYRGGTLIGSSASTSYSDTTTLALTAYTYQVTAYDSAGNESVRSNAASATTPAYPLPSAPTAVTPVATAPTNVNVTWTAGADTGGPGISGYKIYRGGTQIGTAATTSYADSTVVASTTYTYTVAEYDTSGNTSAQSTGANVTTPAAADTTPPSAPGVPTFSAITMTTATVSWTAATDNVAVTSYEYQVNGGAWTNVGNVLTKALTGLSASTTYTVAVHAKDAASNTGAATSAAFTTPDTSAPTAPGAITMSSITGTSATASWGAATDNVGVTSYEYQLNGGAWVNVGNVLTTNITGLSAVTAYSIAVHAKDAAVNIGSSSTTTFNTTLITDNPVMTNGYQGSNGTAGFLLGSFGSMSPATTSNGRTYNSLYDKWSGGQSQAYAASYFSASGFATDPGASWLTSVTAKGITETGSSATYSFIGGIATWTWSIPPNGFGFGGIVNCTIIHK